jgi:cell division protein FtsW (lipid II flippase)
MVTTPSRQQSGYARHNELRWLIASTLLLWFLFVWTERGLTGGEFALTWVQFPWLAALQRYTVALFLAHFVLNWQKPEADQKLLPLMGLLGGMGMLLMYRLPTPYWDADLGYYNYAIQQTYYMGRQTLFLLLGLGVAVFVAIMPWDIVKFLQKYRWLLFFVGAGLLLLTAVFASTSTDGAKVSLNLYFFQLQPSELIKFLVMVFLASYLAQNQQDLEIFTYRYFNIPLPRFLNYLPSLLLVLGVVLVLLVLMSDLGVALVLLGLFPLMVYVALPTAVSRRLILMLGIITFFGYFLLSQIGFTPDSASSNLPAKAMQGINRVAARVTIWQDPWGACTTDNGCLSYQVLQGLYTISSGGLFGHGAGQAPLSEIHFPFFHTDMVVAGVVADWGLLGGLFLLFVYLAFLGCGIRIAQYQSPSPSSSDRFNTLLAVGITSLFGLQLFIIIGGTLALIPLTGITVPFLSWGGTSILVNAFMVGLLLRLSTHTRPQPQADYVGQNIGRVYGLFGLLFGLLALALLFWTIVKAPALHPAFPQFDTLSQNQIAMQWQAVWLHRVERGDIWSADGQLLVTNGEHGRVYTPSARPFAHLLGQTNGIGLGISGLESASNDILLGRGRYDLRTLWARQFAGEWRGNDLKLTIDTTLQNVASQALGNYLGSVVLLDAHTGAVLAMVSHPLYDPSAPYLVEHSGYAPLLNRAIQGQYPPGSTFKAVVAAGALQNELTTPETSYDFRTDQWYRNYNGQLCHSRPWGNAIIPSCNTDLQQMTLTEGFAWSDNILFAQLAHELGSIQLWNTATSFGFHQPIPFDLPTAPSTLATDVRQLDDAGKLAMSGIGQAEVTVTPLQMALVAAAIGNRRGNVPQPYLVNEWLDPEGETIRTHSPRTWIPDAINRRQAEALADMMIATVEDGWGYGAQVEGLVVGGKTGTAEWERTPYGAPPHSWFIGFADLPDGRTVAIAVVAEGAGEGSGVAASIARQLLSAVP